MATFLFDMLPLTGQVKLTLRLAFLLSRKGHEVYYTDSSDSIFTARLLKSGIGRAVYPNDFRWFTPDLVLLDNRLHERSAFYKSRYIHYIYMELFFSEKQLPLNEDTLHLFLAAAPLDYPGKKDKNVFYAGPLLDIRSNEYTTLTMREELLIARLQKMKEQNSKVVIFGLLEANGSTASVYRFYDILKSFCLQHPHYELILFISDKKDVMCLFPLSSNIHLLSRVNCPELLSYCDLILTTGELDILTECVYMHLPILIYPISQHAEQYQNARRIVYHGLGIHGDIQGLTVDKLNEQVQLVLYSKNKILYKTGQMRELFEEKSRKAGAVVTWLEQLTNKEEQ